MNTDTKTQLRGTLWLCLSALLAFGILGCVAVKQTRPKPVPLVLKLPVIAAVTNQARAVSQPSSPTITIAWNNHNPPETAKYMLTEIASKTDLAKPLTFKCYVAAGTNRVTLPKTNAMEFYVCRFVQTNVTPWLLSEWNVK